MRRLRLLALGALPLLVACGGGAASEPYVTSVNPITSTVLQFRVGVATIAYNGGQSVATGLNTVATLRQSDGLSGTLYNVPQVIGPSNFAVTTSTETGGDVLAAGADLGTNHITWSTLNQSQWTGPTHGLKAATTGVFGYGFCPCNQDAGATNGTPTLYEAFNLPIYGSTVFNYYGGPPAFPAITQSVAALGFQGYSIGFTDFAVKPVLGRYALYAAIPPSFTTPANPTPSPVPGGTPTPPPGVLAASAVLSSVAGLPAMQTPGFTPDGKGGGTISVVVPAGVTETMLFVLAVGGSGTGSCLLSHETNAYYTLVTHKRGKVELALADSLAQTSSGTASPTLCPKQTYNIYAAGFDYGAYEASYPGNLSITPPISGASGQADVTTSDDLVAAYPA